MAGDWFYTTNKQQMGPVSWAELRQLAGSRLLMPDDLVWSEGMAEWVKAERQHGLFPDAAGVKRADAEVPPAPAPRRSDSRRRGDEERGDRSREPSRSRRAELERDDRPKEAPPEPRKAGGRTNTGLMIGLGIGAIVLVFVVLGCGVIGLLVWYFSAGGDGTVNQSYTLFLGPNAQNDRVFAARQGQRIQVTTTTQNAPFPPPNISIQILRNGGILANNVGFGPNTSFNFNVPANDGYVVRIINRGPGFVNSQVRVIIN